MFRQIENSENISNLGDNEQKRATMCCHNIYEYNMFPYLRVISLIFYLKSRGKEITIIF